MHELSDTNANANANVKVNGSSDAGGKLLSMWNNSLGEAQKYGPKSVNIVTISEQANEQGDEQYIAAAATMLLDLANTNAELSHAEGNLMTVERVLANSIERNVNAIVHGGSAAGRSGVHLTAKDLMSGEERVLTKASGAMSLLERL